jgi:hypothetical protein
VRFNLASYGTQSSHGLGAILEGLDSTTTKCKKDLNFSGTFKINKKSSNNESHCGCKHSGPMALSKVLEEYKNSVKVIST